MALNKEIDRERLTPGIYLHTRSLLVSTWYVKIDSKDEEYVMTDDILDTVICTMYRYLSMRYGSFRVLGVFRAESGVYVLTRFISNHMIFEAIIDYIMELQCIVSTHCDRDLIISVRDLSRTKSYMLSYYDNYLRYQHTAMKYRK